MEFSFGILALIAITFAAAIVNGAIGYGFSSLTVPVGLLFFTNRLLNPALVLIELIINIYVLIIERIGNSFASGPRKLRRSRGCSLPWRVLHVTIVTCLQQERRTAVLWQIMIILGSFLMRESGRGRAPGR